MTRPAMACMAEFATPTRCVDAARTRATPRAIGSVEAYAPFSVDGLREALGFRRIACRSDHAARRHRRRRRRLSSCSGTARWSTTRSTRADGRCTAGRRSFRRPSSCTVLGAALAAFFGMLILNGLPRLHHPIFNAPDFDLASRNRFFLCIESDGSWLRCSRSHAGFSKALEPRRSEVSDEADLDACLRAKSRFAARSPRVRARARSPAGCEKAMQDMYNQPKYKPLAASRALARRAIGAAGLPGAIAHSAGAQAGHLERPPRRVAVAEHAADVSGRRSRRIASRDPRAAAAHTAAARATRCRSRCRRCSAAASALTSTAPLATARSATATAWSCGAAFRRRPRITPNGCATRPDAHFYSVITNGYGVDVLVCRSRRRDDRWAIVAYIRALQLSQHATLDDLPAEARASLERAHDGAHIGQNRCQRDALTAASVATLVCLIAWRSIRRRGGGLARRLVVFRRRRGRFAGYRHDP